MYEIKIKKIKFHCNTLQQFIFQPMRRNFHDFLLVLILENSRDLLKEKKSTMKNA